MSQKTDAELLDEAAIIKDETAEGANTADRVGTMIENIIDSKLNNEGVGILIAAATSKTTPVDGDSTIISDSEASGAQKKLTWANLKATLKTYFDSIYQAALGYTAENTANKSNSYTVSSTTTYPNTKALVDGIAAANTYADGLVVGLWDDRGTFDASVNAYPSSGGSGTAGAILKGDIWTISVAGTLPNSKVVEVGDTVRALVDGATNAQLDWAILQNNIGYVPENVANKTATIAGNESSNSLYSTVKGIVDWVKDGLIGQLPSSSGSISTLDLLVFGDAADSNKTKVAAVSELITTLNGNVYPKVSTDLNNSFIAGTDGGGYYQQWMPKYAAGMGLSNLANDPIIIGSFNGTGLDITKNPTESYVIFVNGAIQIYGVDYVFNGTDVVWMNANTGVTAIIYWWNKL